MEPSRNGNDWLGEGCYFWENNYQRALDFASSPPGRKVINHPSVVGAVIDLQFCLDLLDAAFLRQVKAAYETLVDAAASEGMELPVNSPALHTKDLLIRKLDYAVIERLHQKRQEHHLKPYDSIRGVFVEGEPLYPGAGFNAKNHIQICIRNPHCIKGFFNPIEDLGWPLN